MAHNINQEQQRQPPQNRNQDIRGRLYRYFPDEDVRKAINSRFRCSEVPVTIEMPLELECLEWRPAAQLDDTMLSKIVLYSDDRRRLYKWIQFCDYLRDTKSVAVVRLSDDLLAYLKPVRVAPTTLRLSCEPVPDQVWAFFRDPGGVLAAAPGGGDPGAGGAIGPLLPPQAPRGPPQQAGPPQAAGPGGPVVGRPQQAPPPPPPRVMSAQPGRYIYWPHHVPGEAPQQAAALPVPQHQFRRPADRPQPGAQQVLPPAVAALAASSSKDAQVVVHDRLPGAHTLVRYL